VFSLGEVAGESFAAFSAQIKLDSLKPFLPPATADKILGKTIRTFERIKHRLSFSRS
jgi:hypothetical protein